MAQIKPIALARAWLADYERVEDFDSDLYAAFLEDARFILSALAAEHDMPPEDAPEEQE